MTAGVDAGVVGVVARVVFGEDRPASKYHVSPAPPTRIKISSTRIAMRSGEEPRLCGGDVCCGCCCGGGCCHAGCSRNAGNCCQPCAIWNCSAGGTREDGACHAGPEGNCPEGGTGLGQGGADGGCAGCAGALFQAGVEGCACPGVCWAGGLGQPGAEGCPHICCVGGVPQGGVEGDCPGPAGGCACVDGG